MLNAGIAVYQRRGLFLMLFSDALAVFLWASMFFKGLGKPLSFHKEKLLNQLVMVVLIPLKVFH